MQSRTPPVGAAEEAVSELAMVAHAFEEILTAVPVGDVSLKCGHKFIGAALCVYGHPVSTVDLSRRGGEMDRRPAAGRAAGDAGNDGDGT